MAFLCIVTGLLISCITFSDAQADKPEPVTGAFITIDKYGNALTDIKTSELTAAGYEIGDILTITIDGSSTIAPFVSTYSDVDRGNPLVRDSKDSILLAINYGNFSKTFGAAEGGSLTLSLYEKGAYKLEYEIRHLVKSENREDYLSDQIFANFRNIAYGNIADGVLYRSCHPANEEARAAYTIKFVEEYQINTIINLADSQEELAENAKRFPYYGDLVADGQVIALDMGVDFTSEEFSAKLKDGLEFMISHEGPYLIHCREGKDRAGMVSALLEALMGATVEEITSDYMETYTNYYGVTKGDPKYDIIAKTILGVLQDINNGTEPTDDNLASGAENYLLHTVGLTQGQIEELKDRLN